MAPLGQDPKQRRLELLFMFDVQFSNHEMTTQYSEETVSVITLPKFLLTYSPLTAG